jgi:DNA-binding response OmpR family regulator
MQASQNRILYVEDHEDTYEMMKLVLGDWGYEVTVARTVANALHLAQSERFELYLLDSQLPDGSGFELCAQICAIAGHAPVVFISGDAYEADKLMGAMAGAVAYFTKPVEFEELKTTVTRLMTGSRGRKAVQDGYGIRHSRKPPHDAAIVCMTLRGKARFGQGR